MDPEMERRGVLSSLCFLNHLGVGPVFTTVYHLESYLDPRCKRSPSRTRHAMLAISMVMYSVSAAHWALVITTLHYGSFSNFGSDIAIIYLPTINVRRYLKS